MASNKATRVRIADAGDSIRRREAFVAGDGSLAGGHAGELADSFGRLPIGHAADLLQEHVNYGGALYVVRSYGTPIAWAGPGEPLTVPDVRYSVTTTRHQRIARRADYPDGICAGIGGHNDPRCGRKGGHDSWCDWTD